jgi:transposase InsO family protein
MQRTVVRLIEVIKDMLGMPFRKVCAALELGYSTFMRWKGRAERGEVLVKKPGPQKLPPLAIDGLEEKVRDLAHRQRRSLGAGSLFEEYKGLVSRRAFSELVHLIREEQKEAERAGHRHIAWKGPGVVFALDDSYYGRDERDRKLYLHSVRDLGARYHFDPLAGDFAKGGAVAKNLERIFNRYGPPLILKRDGGSNLKHEAVEDVLSRYGVIPLESPRRYPPYNGAIERSQAELKRKVWEKRSLYASLPRRHFPVYAAAAAYDLNHLPRRSLGGKVSCQVFFSEKGGACFSKQERHKIYGWIQKLSSAILVELGKGGRRAAQAAWRLAVESWLHLNGYSTLLKIGPSQKNHERKF